MGTNIPGTRNEILAWAESLIGQWGTNQAAIGLTAAQVTELAGDIANARQALTDVQATRANAKAETQDYYAKADAVHTKASKAVTAIKSFAKNSTDPATVFLLAGITGQNPPSPAPAPEQPSNLRAILQNNGAVEVSWTGRGPVGTIYEVYRKLATETTYTFLSNIDASEKKYTDAGVPAGTLSATYQVRAIRGDQFSPYSTAFAIQFGTSDGVGAGAAAAA
jgi:hypothetical protein